MQNGNDFYLIDMQGAENSTYYKEGREKGTIRPYPEYPHYVDPTENPDQQIATEDVWMYGKLISHNSYKADDSVNAFDWSRKLEVNGTDVSWANDVWKAMINERKNLSHYSWDEMCESSEYINSWNTGNGSSAMATWLNCSRDPSRQDKGYYFVLAGRSGGYLPIDTTGCTVAFTNFGFDMSTTGGLNLAPYAYVCYKKGF